MFSPEDLMSLAQTIYGEASGEPWLGKVGVGWVVRNRLESGLSKRFGSTYYDVCMKPWQFSCWNYNDPNRTKIVNASLDAEGFRQSCLAAFAVLANLVEDPTHGSMHYHVTGMDPKPFWTGNKVSAVKINNHVFYNDID